MQEQARRLMPHTVHDGHVVGPHSGIAIDSVVDPHRLAEQRATLLAEREALRRTKAELGERRGAVWNVASLKKWYPPRNLDGLEIREDAALVDQDLYAFLYQTEGGRPLDDGYRVATVNRRDHRFWSGIIRRERALMRWLVLPQERFLDWLLGPQRRMVAGWKSYRRRLGRRHPTRAAFLGALVFLPMLVMRILLKVQEVLLGGLVGLQRKLLDTTVDLPVMVKEGAMDTREEFATSTGRRGLLRALTDETYLTPERRRALLFLSGVMLLLAWLFTEIIIRATYPEALTPKKQTDVLFFYTIATRLALPFPFEFLVGDSYKVLGFVPTVLVAGVGAVVGSWILFIIGGEANKGMKRIFENNRVLDRGLKWLERNAQKFGYPVLGLILSIPFSPDTVPLVVFSLLNLKLKWFLLTVFVATVIRVSIFILVCGLYSGGTVGALCGG